jgi:hypothetical protein
MVEVLMQKRVLVLPLGRDFPWIPGQRRRGRSRIVST